MAITIPFTNLTNVFFDKTSGEFILKDVTAGEGPLPPGCFTTCGFVHVQSVASLLWTVVHNLNTETFSGVHVIDDGTNGQVFPDNVVAVDVNTIEISFSCAMSGRAMVVLFLP